MGAKQSVRGLALEELRAWAKSHDLESFRGNQIFSAVHNQRTDNWGKITSLPKPLRAQLEGSFSIESLILEKKFISLDGTRRFLYRAEDGKVVETVFIPTPNRDTICFSSQAGCALGCSFCLTAKLGFLRNLTVAEIVDQIAITLREVYGVGSNLPHGTNLVAMGEGEPFHNYENLLKAIEIITDKAGMGIAHRRITVSTAGIVPKIRDFSKLSIRPRLAISLSAPNDELRNKLMPINKRWPIGELMKAAREF
ncbi:MAG TPA: 23S rRNA (adenine(2503)-C(2))-methyltransferase RlmN, partial [Pyrinomonadaceae bacterium]|nr:23S rRNA (adenine(2503)-C(2))-methyltransferase RlmN [Pyrinomonadaceae bacterium]